MHVLLVVNILCFLSIGKNVDASEDKLYQERINYAQKIRQQEAVQILSPIVGGTIAPINFHPYLAGILIDIFGLSSPLACGGSILSPTKVLTAAHCWYDGRFQASRFTVVLGSPFLFHGGLRIPTFAIAIHPNYDWRTFGNDIAMLYLPTHVQFNDVIRPIALPFGVLENHDYTGAWVTASGYGRYSNFTTPSTNTMVRHVSLQVIPQDQCSAYYGNVVLNSNICTNGGGGVGICQGDSGGPLTVNINHQEVLIGVSSFVARDGCELGYPSAFARVTSFLSWIRLHL